MVEENKAEKIIERIKSDSEAEASKIIKEGRKEVNRIIREARDKAGEVERRILQKGEREAELVKQRIIADAKLKARKLQLDVKEEVIQKVFADAEKELKKIRSTKKYGNIIRGMTEEAANSLDTDIEVVASKEDKKILSTSLKNLSKQLGKRVTVSPSSIETYGGVVVRARNGKTEVDNTFETRLARMRDTLRSKIAKILFTGA